MSGPNPDDPRLTVNLVGTDQTGAAVETRVPVERSLTLFLNGQEIVTAMTIGDYPEDLAVGYFLNQGMLRPEDVITGIDHDEELAVVVVRTERKTDYEEKLRKKTQTSGCAQGTAFGDLMDVIEGVRLPDAELRTSWLYRLTHAINTMPSLYLEAGAIHGAVLCWRTSRSSTWKMSDATTRWTRSRDICIGTASPARTRFSTRPDGSRRR